MTEDIEDNMKPKGMPGVAGFQQFEFALSEALIFQLVSVLDSLEAAPLDKSHVNAIPNGQGVYQLFLDGELEYIGKTDTEAGLATRLARHSSKTTSRPNLRDKVTFKAVQVLVFSAMELETMLIRHYKANGGSLAWQHSGFGSNDPGRRRDGTRYKDDHFDIIHPIDIDEILSASMMFEAGTTVRNAFDTMKSSLPFIFRYEKTNDLDLKIPQDIITSTVRDGLAQLVGLLPPGWQATRLPGYVIIYFENREYLHGEVIARS